MTQRLTGFFILGNTVLPVVIVMVLIALAGAYGSDLRAGWTQTSENVATVIGAGTRIRNEAAAAAEKAGAHLSEAAASAKKLGDVVDRPVAAIGRAADAIGKIKFKVPFTKKTLGEIFGGPFRLIANALGGLTAPLKELGKAGAVLANAHAKMQAEFAMVSKAGADAQAGLVSTRDATFKLFYGLFVLVVTLAIWFAASFLFFVRARLHRGWSLLVHGREPA